jgi:hypothetical protein
MILNSTTRPNTHDVVDWKNLISQKKPRRQRTPSLSLAEIQELTGDPQIQAAERQLRDAIKAITGWRMTATGGVPEGSFKLAVAYEDALGHLKEGIISATLGWLSVRVCPRCRPHVRARLRAAKRGQSVTNVTGDLPAADR